MLQRGVSTDVRLESFFKTRATISSIVPVVYGLGRKYAVPSSPPLTARPSACKPLAAMMRTLGFKFLSERIRTGPSIIGIIISVMTTAISCCRSTYFSKASAPLLATTT